MNKIILSFTMFFLSSPCFCQETVTHELSQADYLRKSRAQKTAGWILLGAGVAMLAGSAVTYEVKYEPYFDFFQEQPLTTEDVDNTVSSFLAIGAAVATISGVVTFISAMHNKKRGTSLTFSNDRIPVLQQSALVSKMQPTIHLKIPL